MISTRRRAAALALAASLALAGCGSQLDPADLAGVSASGQAASGGDVLDPGVGVTDLDPSSDPGAIPDSGGEVPDVGGGPVGASGPVDSGSPGDPDGGSAPGAPTSAPESEDGGPSAASCDGFDDDQPGVTASTITLANVADISGPVPGIFESARQATKAYVTYFNATQKLCGRSIKLLELDSRADAGADQQAYARACTETFAAVGSMSAFDSGGAATAEECGLPDVRSTSVNPERSKCKTCFSAQSLAPGLVPDALPDYFSSVNKSATQNVALMYVNAGAAPVNAASFKKAWETRGWKVNYFQGIDVAEFNFAPYVQQMKDRGIELVYYVGPYQTTIKIQQTMKQQGFEPEIYLQDSTIYDARYVEQAGDVAEGSYAYSSTALFDDTSNPEMKLYRAWLEQVSPGADPNFFGAYAWSAARLFLDTALELGGDLTRPAMIGKVAKVNNWTGNGLHGPQGVGPKQTGKCLKIIQLTGGSWKQVSKGNYLCGDLVSTGLGG
ncbi:ABC transporter substrate-binding protein [Nocardioides sp.]|uniref:ABC transporter substrate-binding protein n=1 Tax=Nocardioides sp. TaxID=35761 RepID=UPI002B273B31|nr:ABC transporter substrate-binding protein [Nocardioides sp.]